MCEFAKETQGREQQPSLFNPKPAWPRVKSVAQFGFSLERLSVLLVTHDLEEALTVSDTIYLPSQGPKARVLKSYSVSIPRPRDIFASRRHPSFEPMLEQLWSDMSNAMNLPELEVKR